MPDDRQVQPFVHRTRHTVALHFSLHEVQSFMRLDDPDHLALGYTRLMMGGLLCHPEPEVIGMVGLGGGSVVKFCHRHLPNSRMEVAEINPHVVDLRDEFLIPPDDERLAVHVADGAKWVRRQPESFDWLMIDGYDYSGLPSVLATQRFYDDCAQALRPGGLFLANLFREHPQHEVHMDRLRRAFNDAVLEVPAPEGEANNVVLAGPALSRPWWTDRSPPPIDAAAWEGLRDAITLIQRAQQTFKAPVGVPRRREKRRSRAPDVNFSHPVGSVPDTDSP